MGGAAGHMAHPFDLGSVRTGNDLIDFFNKAKEHLETEGAGAVKIDGVNVSFKVVEIDGQHEFAVDRGSLKEIDISGITMSRVDQRFPEGHGMRPAIKTLLTILNKALPTIKPQLKELGMWDNPSMFLNTEYVTGTTNVTDYDENFLAIHGLNQFYEKIAKSGASKGNVRPGAVRPTVSAVRKGIDIEVPIKDPSREVSYDPQVMETLIEKLNPVAAELGFKVYGSVPTNRSEGTDISFDKTLSEPLSIQISDDRVITKPLRDWLAAAQNPDYDSLKVKIITADEETGQEVEKVVTRHPLHKELYKALAIDGVPVVSLVDQADAERAINGALFMHATRMLGNDVLRGLTSPMGDLMSHEGVVLRDEEKFGPNPVKITGEFILGNLGGGFGGSVNENEDESPEDPWDSDADEWYEDRFIDDQEFEDEDDDPVVDSDFSKTVAIVPGAFKPPHNGHLAMVREYARKADEVVIIISRPTLNGRYLPNGKEVTPEMSKAIWEILVSGEIEPENIIISPSHASPINAAYEYVGEEGPLSPGTRVILGASTKDDDWKRWAGAEKYVKSEVVLLDPRETAVAASVHSEGYTELLAAEAEKGSELYNNMPSVKSGADTGQFHASDLRFILVEAAKSDVAREMLADFVGEGNINAVLESLGLGASAELSEMSSGAGAGGSSIEGGASPIPLVSGSDKPAKKKKAKRKPPTVTKDENLDIVNEVMRLIKERGILR